MMKAYLLSALCMMAAQAQSALDNDAIMTNLAGNKLKAGESSPVLVNNARLWGTILFIYIALAMAWKISTDNEPDTSKDSILYAKFLTNKVEKSKMD